MKLLLLFLLLGVLLETMIYSSLLQEIGIHYRSIILLFGRPQLIFLTGKTDRVILEPLSDSSCPETGTSTSKLNVVLTQVTIS